jgi:hypothetical protein
MQELVHLFRACQARFVEHIKPLLSLSRYVVRRDRAARLSGYLRNVALNKILLTNERWPFVLSSNLETDLTIGIDVKHNTVGFTLVS